MKKPDYENAKISQEGKSQEIGMVQGRYFRLRP